MEAKVSPDCDERTVHNTPSNPPVVTAGVRPATRPIRALSRGLALLAELNRLERGAINTLAAAVRLPRTTTFRILETLRLAGYVERDAHDDCYRPTIMVRSLSDGFDDETLVAQFGKGHLSTLRTQIPWPMEIATASGAAMMLRESTQKPTESDRRAAGVRLPMLTSAAGRAFLAFSKPPQRDALLELLAHSSLPEDRLARDRSGIDRLLQETRAQGYGMSQRARRVSEETSLAIPIRAADRVVATLTVRYAFTAVPLRTAIEQFLPRMREVVAKIEREFIEST